MEDLIRPCVRERGCKVVALGDRRPNRSIEKRGLTESKEDRFVGCFSYGEFMAQYFPIFLVVAGALVGVGYAVAACLREWFRGRALLIRAERGDPESPTLVRIGAQSGCRIDHQEAL